MGRMHTRCAALHVHLSQLPRPSSTPAADGWKVRRVGLVENPGMWSQETAQASDSSAAQWGRSGLLMLVVAG